MTNDPGPESGSPDQDTLPELRVSHADRDRVVETLTAAAGEGLLAADELDDRVEAALSARTRGELAVLTVDLPPTGIERQAKVPPAADPRVPVSLRVELAGRIRGGGIVARYPRRTFLQWLLRKPRPYQHP